MSERYDYRAKAEYCREMAAKVMSPLDKEGWLQQATNWRMRMLAALSDRGVPQGGRRDERPNPQEANGSHGRDMENAHLTPIKGNR
jgi:hypothetical protein